MTADDLAVRYAGQPIDLRRRHGTRAGRARSGASASGQLIELVLAFGAEDGEKGAHGVQSPRGPGHSLKPTRMP